MQAERARTERAMQVARPGFIAVNGRALFLWHHSPPSHLRRGAAIVLCPPLGYEYMSAYRTLRILAERLAALGFDAIRFDYDGTGNSAGDVEQPGRVDAWLRSVGFAIAEARRRSGSDPVALVGLRAGALLALEAATRDSVERLVLWSPFPSGKAYVRELKAFAGIHQEDHAREDADDEPGLNVAGYLMTEETVKALEKLKIETITTAPASHVLLVDRDDRPVDPKLAARLDAAGASVTRIQPKGTAEMLDLPQFAKVPEPALEEITAWFRPWLASSSPQVAPAVRTTTGSATLAVHDDCRERTIRFGSGDRLFGVLASPRDEIGDAPSIVLFNTGQEYHVGPHRLYVPLARQWAAHGHHVLRFDLGGIGDSAPPPGAPDNIAYPGHMIDDASEAIAFVRKEAPHRGVVVAGLCSGGWLAFLAAREGLAVDAIVSINPPMYLREQDAGAQWLTDGDELERYQQSMRDPSKWLKALRGDAAYATFVRLSASALGRSVAVRVSGVLGDALPDGLASDLCAIAGRGIRSLFVFSRGDDGLEYFQLHAQPALRRARVRDFVQHLVVEGAGHTFRPRAAQRTLREILIDFVASQSGGSGPSPTVASRARSWPRSSR